MTPDTIYSFLHKSSISFERYEHPPAVTVEEADRVIPFFDGIRTKNLFLRNSSGKSHFLVTVKSEKVIDIKQLSVLLGKGKIGFASVERLHKYLGVAPGALSLLSIFNDADNEVELIVDQDVWNATSVLCHPFINTVTLVIPMEPLKKLIESTGHRVLIINV